MSRMIEVPEYRLHEEVHVDPARTALVVVDMQNDFVREGGSLRVPDAEATIPAISNSVRRAAAPWPLPVTWQHSGGSWRA